VDRRSWIAERTAAVGHVECVDDELGAVVVSTD